MKAYLTAMDMLLYWAIKIQTFNRISDMLKLNHCQINMSNLVLPIFKFGTFLNARLFLTMAKFAC